MCADGNRARRAAVPCTRADARAPCRYEALMEACGGDAYAAASAAQLATACRIAFGAARPALINIAIDPTAGVESGNVHAFNAAKPSL